MAKKIRLNTTFKAKSNLLFSREQVSFTNLNESLLMEVPQKLRIKPKNWIMKEEGETIANSSVVIKV